MDRLACCFALCLLTIGCASPGPPRAPSLHLPEPVTDLAAERVGDAVLLTFNVPHLSTDKLPLYSSKAKDQVLRGRICREVEHTGCLTLAGLSVPLTAADHNPFTYSDVLPAAMVSGQPQLLSYRIEFFNSAGRSAGTSEAAFSVTGSAPQAVRGLHATGTRAGVLLRWEAAPEAQSDVLLERTDLASSSTGGHKPDLAAATRPSQTSRKNGNQATRSSGSAEIARNRHWLNANATANETIDSTVAAGEPYRYTALRRISVRVDNHLLELRSPPSAPVEITLQARFPPASPVGVTAAGFQPEAAVGQTGHFAVDLVWQPVFDDAGISARLTPPIIGYNVYRRAFHGDVLEAPVKLTATPVPVPGYHDQGAEPNVRYRYGVTTVDAAGNESPASTLVFDERQGR